MVFEIRFGDLTKEAQSYYCLFCEMAGESSDIHEEDTIGELIPYWKE